MDQSKTSTRRRVTIETANTTVDCTIEGDGLAIALLPSLARDADDFDPLAEALARAGYRVIRPAPRGIGQSRGPDTGITLADLAADVAAAIEGPGNGRAIVLGHAFGNWVARNVAVHYPHLVAGLVLAAAAAKVQPLVARRAVETASDPARGDGARLAALEIGFFAPGHDARAWLHGWHPQARAIQRSAVAASPREGWWHAGGAPILDLIAAHDPFRPRSTWDENRHDLGSRVTVAVIPDASHALIPEQPEAVAAAIVAWARGLPATPASGSR